VQVILFSVRSILIYGVEFPDVAWEKRIHELDLFIADDRIVERVSLFTIVQSTRWIHITEI